jgi:hypothetical protein
LDRTRRVIGGETYWQMPAAVTSVTVFNEVFAMSGAQQVARISANTPKTTGKLYFEVNLSGDSTPGSGPGGGNDALWVGVSRNGGSSYTQTGVGAVSGMLAVLRGATDGTRACKDGVTISYTVTPGLVTGYSYKALVAVDLDAGKIWFGRGGEAAYWGGIGGNGDPATGANPALTFTANTPMYPAIAFYEATDSFEELTAVAAFEAGAQRFDPPTGFSAWSDPEPTETITATVTPSGVTSLVTWPFGIEP